MYRSWAEIDLGQIVKNYKVYKNSLAQGASAIAVVKANAYGHGDVEVSRALEEAEANFFAVSNINEGIRLRLGGINGKILVLGYTPPSRLSCLAKYRIMQTIVGEYHLEELKMYALKDAEFYIAIDTGMHRIGFSAESEEETVNYIKKASESLKISGIFTHLAAADSDNAEDADFTKEALSKFNRICDGIPNPNLYDIHCLNSAGGISCFDSRFSAVRLGIALYGYSPSPSVNLPQGISPALSWKTIVSAIIKAPKGDSVGYGRSFIAERDMKIATLATGYADGYPRAGSNKGCVLIKGKRARIVGKVCMDMMMVDVTDIPEAKMGDEAILIGSCGDEKITADDIAKWSDTISYEILTGISARVERIYK